LGLGKCVLASDRAKRHVELVEFGLFVFLDLRPLEPRYKGVILGLCLSGDRDGKGDNGGDGGPFDAFHDCSSGMRTDTGDSRPLRAQRSFAGTERGLAPRSSAVGRMTSGDRWA